MLTQLRGIRPSIHPFIVKKNITNVYEQLKACDFVHKYFTG